MSSDSPLKIAILGAGPSGFYAAQALLDADQTCEIDILDRLPTPYGLIRSGVAPDHPTTKNIQATFERTAEDPRVRLFGNVTVGRDVQIDDLRAIYDAVILAIGAPLDARLDVPGRELAGVYGAAEFVGWYNGHPDFADLDPALDQPGAVVIGNGNVAIDIARILSKSVAEIEVTDIADHAIRQLERSAIRDVHVVGRRGAVEAKFTNVELAELGTLQNAVAVTAKDALPDTVDPALPARDRRLKEKNLRSFHEFAAADPASRPRRIHFVFYARPHAIEGTDRVEAMVFERLRPVDGALEATGELITIPCGLVVTAIGYRRTPLGADAAAELPEVDASGRIERGLYAVGWFKRGPSGKIATNRADGEAVAKVLLDEVEPSGREGREALLRLLSDAGVRWTDFGHWKHIDAEEVRSARPAAPRRKMTRIADMLDVIRAQN